MRDSVSLTNSFLIAMPALGDPNFFRTVTLICEHTDEGAMGIVINRPIEITFSEVLAQMEIEPTSTRSLATPVHLGGPVQNNRGFVLHEPIGNWESSLKIGETLAISTSRDILVAIAEDRGPKRCLLALGYAGWSAGQLEQEIADNAWLSGPASHEILFDTPSELRWHAAVSLLGIDIAALSGEAGHA